jgi:hypothetical protein
MKKKIIKKKHDLVAPPPYTEGHWEDEFEYYTNYQSTSNNGKWWAIIQIEKLKKKLNRCK